MWWYKFCIEAMIIINPTWYLLLTNKICGTSRINIIRNNSLKIANLNSNTFFLCITCFVRYANIFKKKKRNM